MKIKRVLPLVCLLILIMAACTKKGGNITFTATVESTAENSIMVTTSDDVGFDRASVGYGKDMLIDFLPRMGQKVEITILPQIRESYPVQVTAIRIKLIETGNTLPAETKYTKITALEAKAMMDGEDVIVLDIRSRDDYDKGHIQNAVALPRAEIETNAQTVLPDKDARILVYCKTGLNSPLAAQLLVEMGYTHVYEFGGINDWPFEIVK